jgi:hypothetical protein
MKSAKGFLKYESPGHNSRLENYFEIFNYIHSGIWLLVRYKFDVNTGVITK